MKSLFDYITEGVNHIVVAFDYYNQGRTFIVLNAKEKDLPKSTFDYFEASPKKNIICIKQNDAECVITDVANSESQIKKEVMKTIQASWDELEKEGYAYIETPIMDIELIDGETWDGESAEQVYDDIMKYVDDSSIDGDSSSAYCLVDINKQKVVRGDGLNVVFQTVDEFMEMFED